MSLHAKYPIHMQALKVLKEMQQRKAFTALLDVALAEAGKLNAKACSHEMRSLDLAMHIAAGTLPQACALSTQVGSLLEYKFCGKVPPTCQAAQWWPILLPDESKPTDKSLLLASKTDLTPHKFMLDCTHVLSTEGLAATGECNHAAELIVNVQLVDMDSPCLPKRQLAEVHLMSGDLRDSLGLRSDAHKLWQEGLSLAEQECQALGLKERQVRCYIQARCYVEPA